jgi:ribosomal protein S16
MTQPADPAQLWKALLARLEALAGELLEAPGAPAAPADRAEGVRYLARYLAAGLRVCVESDDPDYPAFARMIDGWMSWGLDNPDCNYSWARVRGDACYRIAGWRGSARHLELQVNTGHLGDGNVPALGGGDDAWRTVSFLGARELETDAAGRFEVWLSAEPRPGNWLRLDHEARYVLVRQYFDDWETEEPARFAIERVGAPYPEPRLDPERLAARFETLHTWLDAGARCWDRVSRLLLSLPPNGLLMFDVSDDVDRPGLHGQAYGMGPFACAPDEAVIVELRPPRCLMWSVALANFWWESMEFARRQSSLNSHWARLDSDGVFRGVIAHRDPGVPNWLDPEGSARGTLAVRFLFGDQAPKPELRVVKLARLRDALPADTPRVSPEERSAVLARRSRAVQLRYGY